MESNRRQTQEHEWTRFLSIQSILMGERGRIYQILEHKMKSERKQNYHNFLKSSHWSKIREKSFKKNGRKCFIYGNVNYLHIHHASYKDVYKARVTKASKNTFVLCAICHKTVHEVQKERGKTLEETYPIMIELKTDYKKAKEFYKQSIEAFESALARG